MASNALMNHQNDAVSTVKSSDKALTDTKSSNVIKKYYILNDLEAIKKKLDNEYLQPEIQISGEAVEGANTIISMKTSPFEYAKQFLMEALKQDTRIIKAGAVKKVVAKTNFQVRI